tara:strand:- start:2176 stop:2574 length:399 start_codon:yes stop_codon:yes gene_type:complete
MLFSCGIGVGIYYWGVSEPVYHYRGGAVYKIPVQNDDDRAQVALFITLFHWGLHGWCPYILVAVALGLVCYRWNMPLTMRSAFYPLLGHLVYSPLGDLIDALSIGTYARLSQIKHCFTEAGDCLSIHRDIHD